MENPRPPLQNSSKPFKKRKNFQKPDERTGAYKKLQPRDSKSQPRENKLNSPNGRLQDQEERFGNRNINPNVESNKFQTKKNLFSRRIKNIKAVGNGKTIADCFGFANNRRQTLRKISEKLAFARISPDDAAHP